MAPDRRNQLVLMALAIVLAYTAYQLWPRTAAATRAAANVRGTGRAAGGSPAVKAPDVRLEALSEERPKPGDQERDLFRFKPRSAPPPTPVQTAPPVAVPSGPPPPPAVPPIALKFIAIYEVPGLKKKYAVLSDGRGGASIYGSEGETIEGRYKILRIGAESIEMSYVDGQGRQTIRLTGQ